MTVFGNAKYIKAQPCANSFSLHDPLPFFRREFEVCKSEVKDARVYVQAPGFAEFFINGKPITEDKFISPISDYRRILWYNDYDVTDLLCDGVNTFAVIASNGFFNESLTSAWTYEKAEWRDAPQFILCLKINGEDFLVSDESWKYNRHHSHIIFSHLRAGEYVDMRKYDPSWMYTGFEENKYYWKPALVREPSELGGEFRTTKCPPVRETEIIEPVSITETADGYLVDFGINSSGYAEITLQAHKGQEIIFRYCEDLDENLRPKHNGMNHRGFYGEDTYEFQVNKLIASGGVDTFKPKFSYHGFRYIVIEGLDKAPEKENIRAFFTHNDVPRKSDFTSGNEILNYIYTAGMRSTQSNLFWSLTDCPTREKLGWMNDAQASLEQTLINFDIVEFYRKWFEDMKVDQLESGEVHGVIPTWGWGSNWGPVCDFCLFELPYRLYVYTGDGSLLRSAIPHFELYIDFLENKIAENHEFKLADWTGHGNVKAIPKPFIREIYFIKALRALSTAQALSGISHAETDAKLARCEKEFLDTYLAEDGRCNIDEQTSCAMMIMFGLYTDKDVICKQLVSVVERDECKLSSGMVGVQYLYDALSECGRADLAYKIITESEPGYKTWYEHGATTLWETWGGIDNGSHNHHMYSNVIAWFFKSLLGIAPNEKKPAFEEAILAPKFVKEAGFVKGYEDTVRGRIYAEWKYENGGFNYKVTIPDGIIARYDGRILEAGEHSFFIKD